jgi:Arc/MetJ-type ribon-helix-helix transcriptional regulator
MLGRHLKVRPGVDKVKQTTVNLQEGLLKKIDKLVEEGFFPSRTRAVEYAVSLLIQEHRKLGQIDDLVITDEKPEMKKRVFCPTCGSQRVTPTTKLPPFWRACLDCHTSFRIRTERRDLS